MTASAHIHVAHHPRAADFAEHTHQLWAVDIAGQPRLKCQRTNRLPLAVKLSRERCDRVAERCVGAVAACARIDIFAERVVASEVAGYVFEIGQRVDKVVGRDLCDKSAVWTWRPCRVRQLISRSLRAVHVVERADRAGAGRPVDCAMVYDAAAVVDAGCIGA